MRCLLGTLLLVGSLLSASPLEACGDKLLILGRPLRFNTRPAAILTYAPTGSFLESFLKDPEWISAMSRGKHRLRVARTLEQLVQNLQLEHFDVIIADSGHAAAMRSQLSGNPTPAVFVPVVDSASRHVLRTAEKEYSVAMKGTGKSGDYLSAIGRAVDLHDRRVEAATREKKKQVKNS